MECALTFGGFEYIIFHLKIILITPQYMNSTLYVIICGNGYRQKKRNDTGRAGRETLCEQADYLQMGAGHGISGNE